MVPIGVRIVPLKNGQYIVSNPSGQTRSYKLEIGAKPNSDEQRALNTLSQNGLSVIFQRTASEKGIQNQRTADTNIIGFGQVDIITPVNTTSTAISRIIEKKDSQAPVIYINLPTDAALQRDVANRVFGKPNASNIQAILFENQDGTISVINRGK